jgi:polyphenol oxidase
MISHNNYINKSLIFNSSGSLSYLQFNSLLRHANLAHGIFTRNGGVSLPPYNSLNVSYNTGDLSDNVRENLGLIKDAVGARQIVSMNQVHGTDILTFHENNPHDLVSETADAIITDVPLLGILVKQADCQGVIIFDAVRSVVAAVHSGWRGNVQDILGVVVKKMELGFGCEAKDLTATIGPSLGPCCAEFTTYREIFPEEFKKFIVDDNHFNLWEISRMQLSRAGLMKDNIKIAGICTKCNTSLFYSYRGEGATGRFGTVVMLKE